MNATYFYDDRGDELFQRIIACPEYYLTRAEAEILSQQSHQILQRCADEQEPFDLVELGAGDGFKTFSLLQAALELGYSRRYFPIDISPGILTHLSRTLSPLLPGMHIHGLSGEYFDRLEQL